MQAAAGAFAHEGEAADWLDAALETGVSIVTVKTVDSSAG